MTEEQIKNLSPRYRDFCEQNFMKFVSPEPNSGCWLWVGSVTRNGYGAYSGSHHSQRGAHRVAYEVARGPIPEGLHLDHLCRVRSCVNPDHLDAVSCRENVLRGVGPSAVNAAKTHCKRGHELSGYNVLATICRGRAARACRTCYRDATRAGRARRRAA